MSQFRNVRHHLLSESLSSMVNCAWRIGKKMWELLQHIKDKSHDPWLALSDFNEALWQFEHFSTTKGGEVGGDKWKIFEMCYKYVICMTSVLPDFLGPLITIEVGNKM